MTVVAVIGGTGAALFPRAAESERLSLPGNWGTASAEVLAWEQHGHRVLFLARHGEAGSIPPHRVNYRANMRLLADLGAEQVIALNAVGGIGVPSGALVVPDQLLDYTWGRPHTFFDNPDGPTEFVDFTEPYDSNLRKSLIKACAAAGSAAIATGTYGATQGPRLESAAEIRRLRQDGCTVVGMTGMPEAGLARELGLPYACLALVVNAAAGSATDIEPAGIHAAIEQHLQATVTAAGRVISCYLEQL